MRIFKVALVLCFILTFYGCATTGRSSVSQRIGDLEMRVDSLESQMQQQGEDIRGLEVSLVGSKDKDDLLSFEDMETAQIKPKAVAKWTPKNIQLALRNAGFYSGTIDGKIGKLTRSAIVNFQKANGLKADGIVGTKTWSSLSQYLN